MISTNLLRHAQWRAARTVCDRRHNYVYCYYLIFGHISQASALPKVFFFFVSSTPPRDNLTCKYSVVYTFVVYLRVASDQTCVYLFVYRRNPFITVLKALHTLTFFFLRLVFLLFFRSSTAHSFAPALFYCFFCQNVISHDSVFLLLWEYG